MILSHLKPIPLFLKNGSVFNNPIIISV